MSDQELWRKNIPEDYDGRFGKNWDDEVDVGFVIKSNVAIAVLVAIAFVFCWLCIEAFDAVEPRVEVPALVAAGLGERPPTPRLQASPEMELDEMLEEQEKHLSGYGWMPGEQQVHIPVDRAMDLVLAARAAGSTSPEPAEDPPVDVATPVEVTEEAGN